MRQTIYAVIDVNAEKILDLSTSEGLIPLIASSEEMLPGLHRIASRISAVHRIETVVAKFELERVVERYPAVMHG